MKMMRDQVGLMIGSVVGGCAGAGASFEDIKAALTTLVESDVFWAALKEKIKEDEEKYGTSTPARVLRIVPPETPTLDSEDDTRGTFDP